MVHVVVVGNGRIGRPTAYSILTEGLADELSLVDTKPKLAWAYGEELKHAAASLGYDVEINAYDKDDGPSGADLVVVCPGKPRTPGVQMDRRDLAVANAATIKQVAEQLPPRNRGAKYMVISNPVDAMATLFKKVSKASFVVATGDCPDTLRYRVNVAEQLKVPVSGVEGFVGGEHGSAAYPLWSLTTVNGWSIDDYLAETGKKLDRDAATAYVRGVSKQLVDTIGATEFGPAAGFRDIARAILEDSGDLISFATPRRFKELPEPVHVSVPTFLGASIGPDLWEELTGEEQANIKTAAKAIYDNYKMAAESVGL